MEKSNHGNKTDRYFEANLDDTDDFQSVKGSNFRIRKNVDGQKRGKLSRKVRVGNSEKGGCGNAKRSRVFREETDFESASASSGQEIELHVERDKRTVHGPAKKEVISRCLGSKKSRFENVKPIGEKQSEGVTDSETCPESNEETSIRPGKVLVEKLTGLSPEKRYVVRGQWILPSKWLHSSTDTTSGSRSHDEWSEVVGTSETMEDEASDMTVHASDLTSESRDELSEAAESDVMVKPSKSDVQKDVDIQDDHELAKRLAAREEEKLTEERLMDEEVFICQMCHKDISHMNSMRKMQHVNKCLDKEIEEEEQRLAEEASVRRLQNALLPCPICDAKFKQPQARKNHLSACAKRRRYTPQELKVELCKQQQEYLTKLVSGQIPIIPEKEKKKATGKKKQTKIVKEPANKFEEDLQITLALSRSLTESSDNVPVTSVKPIGPAPAQKSTKGKKKNEPAKVPLLVARGSEDRRRMIEERVFGLIQDDISPFPNQVPGLKPSKLLEDDWDDTLQVVIGEKDHSLWWRSCIRSDEILEKYYVACLMPPISPCKVAMGSKIKRMSQVPGRKKSLASQFVVSPAKSQPAEKASAEVVEFDSSRVFDDEDLLSVSDKIPATGFCTIQKDEDINDEEEATRSCYQDTVIMDFKKMIGNPQLSDVSIMCKNVEYVPAHKFVLAARCPKLLEEVKRDKIIEFADVLRPSIMVLLTYLYTGEILHPDLEEDDVLSDVGSLSQRFELHELLKECRKKGWEAAAAAEGTSAGEAVTMEIEEMLKSFWEDEEEIEEDDASDQENKNVKMNDEDLQEIYEFMSQKNRANSQKSKSLVSGEEPGIVDYDICFDDVDAMRESLVDEASWADLSAKNRDSACEGDNARWNLRSRSGRKDSVKSSQSLLNKESSDDLANNHDYAGESDNHRFNHRSRNDGKNSVKLSHSNISKGTDGSGDDIRDDECLAESDPDCVVNEKERETGKISDWKMEGVVKNGICTVQVDGILFEDHGTVGEYDRDDDSVDMDIDETIWTMTEVSPSKQSMNMMKLLKDSEVVCEDVGSKVAVTYNSSLPSGAKSCMRAENVSDELGRESASAEITMSSNPVGQMCGKGKDSKVDSRSASAKSSDEQGAGHQCVEDVAGKDDPQGRKIEEMNLSKSTHMRDGQACFQSNAKAGCETYAEDSESSVEDVAVVESDFSERDMKKTMKDLQRKLEEKCAVARRNREEREKFSRVGRYDEGSSDSVDIIKPDAGEQCVDGTNDNEVLQEKGCSYRDKDQMLQQKSDQSVDVLNKGCSYRDKEQMLQQKSNQSVDVLNKGCSYRDKDQMLQQKSDQSVDVLNKGCSYRDKDQMLQHKIDQSVDVLNKGCPSRDEDRSPTREDVVSPTGSTGFDIEDFRMIANEKVGQGTEVAKKTKLSKNSGPVGAVPCGNDQERISVQRIMFREGYSLVDDRPEDERKKIDTENDISKSAMCGGREEHNASEEAIEDTQQFEAGAKGKERSHFMLEEHNLPVCGERILSETASEFNKFDRNKVGGRQSGSFGAKDSDLCHDRQGTKKVSTSPDKTRTLRSVYSHMVIGSDGTLFQEGASLKKKSRASEKCGVGKDLETSRRASENKPMREQEGDGSFALPRSPSQAKIKKSTKVVINDERIAKKSPKFRNPGSPVVKLRKLSARSLNLSNCSAISRRGSDVVQFGDTPGRDSSAAWQQSSTPRSSTVRDYTNDDSLFLSPVNKDRRTTFQLVTPRTGTQKQTTQITETSQSQKILEKGHQEEEEDIGHIVKTQEPPTLDIDTPTQSFVEDASSASLFDASADRFPRSPRFDKVYHSPPSKLGDVRNYTNLSDSDDGERPLSLRPAPHLIVAESPTAHIQSNVIDISPDSPIFSATGVVRREKSPRKKSTSLFTLLDSPKVHAYSSPRQSPESLKAKKRYTPSPKIVPRSPSNVRNQMLKRKRLQSNETDADRLKRKRHGVSDNDNESDTASAKRSSGELRVSRGGERKRTPFSGNFDKRRGRNHESGIDIRQVGRPVSPPRVLRGDDPKQKQTIIVEILDSSDEDSNDNIPGKPASRQQDRSSLVQGGNEEFRQMLKSNRDRNHCQEGVAQVDGDVSKQTDDVVMQKPCLSSGSQSPSGSSGNKSRQEDSFLSLSIPDAYDENVLVPSPRFNRMSPTSSQNASKSKASEDGLNHGVVDDVLAVSPAVTQRQIPSSRAESPDMFDDDEVLTGGPEITVLSDDTDDEYGKDKDVKTKKKSGDQDQPRDGHKNTLIAFFDDGSFEEEQENQENLRTDKTPAIRKKRTVPSPYTPMPDYDNMKTPHIKTALSKIGVRPMAKKKSIKLLKHVYEETHQYETDPDFTPDAKKQGVIVKEKIRRVVTFEKQADQNQEEEDDRCGLLSDIDVPLSSRLGLGKKSAFSSREVRCDEEQVTQGTRQRPIHEISDSESDLDHSSGSTTTSGMESDSSVTDDADLTLSQQESNRSLKEKILSFIKRDKALYTMVLKYQPIELGWLANKLKEAGLGCSANKLIDILDEQCIVFKDQRRPRKTSPRKRKTSPRKRKKVTSSTSSSPRKVASPKKATSAK